VRPCGRTAGETRLNDPRDESRLSAIPGVPIDLQVTVAASPPFLEPISPELVLVDPALRQAVLSFMQSEAERALRSSENGAGGSRESAESAPRSGSEDTQETEDAGPEPERAAKPAHARIGSLSWWSAVVLYSFVVVALVIGFSFVSRLI
jgi:hypothetical protein